MQWLEALTAVAHEQISAKNAKAERAREALYCRGVTDKQIDLYRIGYLDQKLPELEDAESFLKWSVNGRKLEDVFVFPLTNTLGQVKGFQFRSIRREKKDYMDFVSTKEEPVLFGLGQAMPTIWETESVFLVEGVFDLFPLQRVHPDVVATLTNRISDPFGRLLRRLVREIWLAYDMDQAGWDARTLARTEYAQDFEFPDVKLPRIPTPSGKWVKDLGELWEVWGDERLGVFLRRLKDPYQEKM